MNYSRVAKEECIRIIEKYRNQSSINQLTIEFSLHENTIRKIVSAKHPHSMEYLKGKSILRDDVRKIRQEDRLDIESKMTAGVPAADLAKRFGVTSKTIVDITSRVRRDRKRADEKALIIRPVPVTQKSDGRYTIFKWARDWEMAYDLAQSGVAGNGPK